MLRSIAASARLHRAHLATLGSLTVGTAFSALGLARGLENRLPLELLWGAGGLAWSSSLALAVLLGALSLVLRMRSMARGRSARPWADLRALFCVLVASWVGFLALLQPFQRLYWDMSAGLAWGVFAGWMIVGDLRPVRPRTRKTRTLHFALFQLCLGLVVGEVTLRLASRFLSAPIFTQLDALPEQFEHVYRAEPGSLRFGFPCNSTGHYDEEFTPERRADHRVVTIGDSFSMGVVPHHHHFTTVCERRLGDTEVLNLGFFALGPADYARLLTAEALPLAPDLVVIDLFVGNDIGAGILRLDQPDAELRRWFDRRNLLVWLVPQRWMALRAASAGESDRTEAVHGEPGGLPGRIAPEELERHYPWLADPPLETPTIPESSFLPLEAQRARHACSGDLQPYVQLELALAAMRDLAGRTQLAVMLIPDEYQVEDDLWEHVERESSDELVRDRPQQRLAVICARLEIPLLDLLPALRAVTPLEDGRRHVYHRQDTHFNARGNAAAGEALAVFVRRILDSR